MVKILRICKIKGFNKNAILLMRKQGIPVYDHYKMFKNRNNNASQKRLAKFALIKYRINLRNYGIYLLPPLPLFPLSLPLLFLHSWSMNYTTPIRNREWERRLTRQNTITVPMATATGIGQQWALWLRLLSFCRH